MRGSPHGSKSGVRISGAGETNRRGGVDCTDMSIRMSKAWQPFDAEHVARLPGQLGVYELADSSGETVRIGFAGGRAAFGLRSELEHQMASHPAGFRFRVEVNMQYTTRHRELLMAYHADHGKLPRENAGEHVPLGRLSPS